jgi:putative DNA primase/helicase
VTKKKSGGVPDTVAAMLEEANRQAALAAGDVLDEVASGSDDDSEGSASNPLDAFAADAPDMAADPATPEDGVIQWCAKLDHSDTDNAARLLSHFGRNLLVVTQTKARAPLWAVWTGRNWDADTGAPRAFALSQKVGSRIAMEIGLIGPSEAEAKVLAAAEALAEKPDGELTAADKATLDLSGKIKERIRKRKDSRIKHSVTSKNKGRIEAMLACGSPHVMRGPDEFNADKLKVAVNGHTLSFRKFVRDEVIHRGDPDNEREIEVQDAEMKARRGHRRTDLITQVVPVDYDKDADCPQWRAFMTQMLPVERVRRMVQVASGLGLVGITVQKLFFHFGAGANGKSVYMETMCRLLGETAVTLPASSFIGEGASGGQATPDIARLYGRRFLRVKELPEGEELRESFVKEATGGEALSARDLFLGYFDFEPLFTAHMSGNGFPRITGTDEGIWRRMAVVHWPVQVPEKARLPFEEMVARFEPEYSGILNWLIEGLLIYLRDGLDIPDEVTAATAEMRFEMDPTAQFCRDCVAADEQGDVRGNALYEAYVRHAEDQAGKHARPVSIQRFGRIMKKKYGWRDDRGTTYRVRLHDVPVKSPGNTYPDGYGGPGT